MVWCGWRSLLCVVRRPERRPRRHEFITLENENHYLTRTATRTQTLEALGRFLAKNLPVN